MCDKVLGEGLYQNTGLCSTRSHMGTKLLKGLKGPATKLLKIIAAAYKFITDLP
jgi:hypothetical protein